MLHPFHDKLFVFIKADFHHPESIHQIAALLSAKKANSVAGNDNTSDRCDNCVNPANVSITGNDGEVIARLCIDCHNRLMAEMTDTEMSVHVPKRLTFKNSEGDVREFEVEFRIFPNGKTLTAIELGETKRRADVSGELDDDFNEMLETLTVRIKKALPVTSIDESGYILGCKAVGYIQYNHEREACDVIIDGKAYTWADLEQNISGREGFKIKIEFGDIGEELD